MSDIESPLYTLVKLAKNENKQSKNILDMIRPYLNDAVTLQIIKKNQYITTPGTPTQNVYYVVTGSFVMKRGSIEGKNTIRTQAAPCFLGVDYAILSYHGYYPEIRAWEKCIVLKIEKNYFLQAIKQDRKLCYEVLYEICKKFFRASLRFDQIYFYDPPTRFMIYIVNYWISKHGDADQISIEVSNSEIAEEIGISIRTFYRILNKFKDDGLISTVVGNISVTEKQIRKMENFLHDYEDIDMILSLYE